MDGLYLFITTQILKMLSNPIFSIKIMIVKQEKQLSETQNRTPLHLFV